MAKIIVSIHSTCNGIVTGPPNDETNFVPWAQPGIADVLEHFLTFFDNVDTILLGRKTYEDLARKWPVAKDWPDVDDITLRLADLVNLTPKLVVGSPEKTANLKWGDFDPPTALTGDVVEKIRALKETNTGDIITFGSPTLVGSLTNANLVDEYRIQVHPVIVPEGRHLFDDLTTRKDFDLKSSRTFEHGSMMVHYGLTH